MERLIEFYRVGSSVGALIALILANLVPLAGVLFWGWNVWTILILYWIENGIVGAYNILKMLKAEGPMDPTTAGWQLNGRPANTLAKAGLIPFFVMHYGIFWAVHGIFVLTLPLFGGMSGDVDMVEGTSPNGIVFAVILLVISHGISYRLNFIGRGEYRRVSPAVQMFAPYGRLVVLHMTIIFGALAISFTGAPQAAVAILVMLKTALDIGFHLRANRRPVVEPAG